MSNTATAPTLSQAAKRAVTKYGIDTCIQAYALHLDGNGSGSIRFDFAILNGRTNSADAAINAGRELAGHSI